MAEIHPLAFIIVGIVVTIVSVFVGLTFFIYAGVILMAWGLGKASFKRLKEPRELKRTGPVPTQEPIRVEHPGQVHYVHCRRCGNRVRPTDQFCSRCGSRRSQA
jgi:hypothetical protein